MIISSIRVRKQIACFFLALLLTQGLTPLATYALTSGPAQPEAQRFTPANTNDLVDLFTGDFKYNIPLGSVGGYPLNLSYKSGTGMDDEASWVGLGWSLNVGAINRQLRGVADDSYGDQVVTHDDMKTKIVYGGMASVRGEVFGGMVSGSLSVGVFNDNYTGVGASVGVNAGLSMSKFTGGALTPGLNVGVTSSTQNGATVTPSVSLSLSKDISDGASATVKASVGIGYNTREGLKDLTLGTSFTLTAFDIHNIMRDGEKIGTSRENQGNATYNGIGSSISYNTPAFYPKTNVPFASSSYSFSLDAGPAGQGGFAGLGGSGYKTVRQIANKVRSLPAYGFMYAEKGKNDKNALMDFMREKENPVIPELQNLPLPIATPDIFGYTSQTGSGEFRLFRNSTGVFFDNTTEEVTENKSNSVELGVGWWGHAGTSIYNQTSTNSSGKWVNDNNFLPNGDFAAPEGKSEEAAYFKQIGEKESTNPNFYNRVLGDDAVNVPLEKKTATGVLRNADKSKSISDVPLKRDGRQVRHTAIMALTAEEAKTAGFDKEITSYPLATSTPVDCNKVTPTKESRQNSFRKAKHISEFTIMGDDGKRMIYGIPVYNKKQVEYTFATTGTPDPTTNLVSIPTTAEFGRADSKKNDNYYHREEQPAYATSWLLTQIVSPDYVDLTGDGITEDDRGTAVKFNYTRTADNYNWRSPVAPNKANFQRGLGADPDDNKASFVFGEKELWYITSIESKNEIAYFITSDRLDARAVDSLGNKISAVSGQKRLDTIKIYSRSDLKTPKKTIVFQYNASGVLCHNTPNSDQYGNGKLTLYSVHFNYRSSEAGTYHPYSFTYGNNPDYAFLSTDRWGTYKSSSDNEKSNFGAMDNMEFPYTKSDYSNAWENADTYQLTTIKLPSGGTISVNYESDDYAYVQDQRAMQMARVTHLITNNGETNSFKDAKGIEIEVPAGDATTFSTTTEFKKKYLNGSDYLYAKFFVNMTDEPTITADDHFDYISAYGKVKSATRTDNKIRVIFEDDTDGDVNVNPFISAAWQKMRLEYPRYAYPGYNNRINDDKPVKAILSALLNALKTMGELTTNFNKRAYRKGFANTLKLNKSMARLVRQDGHKLGGGIRVSSLSLGDNWSSMDREQNDTYYQQVFDYTIKENGATISSGVATFEPSLGGDENAMHTPVNYTQDVKWGLNNYFYMEQPMGETLFPSPSVGYRKVSVYNYDKDWNPANKAGWNSSEFYTAKEYPVIIKQTPLQQYLHNPVGWTNFFGGSTIYELAMSQGYSIILNDMHGKPKRNQVFNQSGDEVSAEEYFYNSTEEGGTYRISNKVDVVDNNGQITKDQVIGRDVDVFADMRYNELYNTGKSINIGFDVMALGFWPLPIPHFPWNKNTDYRSYNSASVVKTVQYYGTVSKIEKRVNGSSITTETLLYDKYTGEPVLSQTQNEFNDPIYSLNIPAYWMYSRMGMAYKNMGMLLSSFSTDADGAVSSTYSPYLTAGDELVDVGNGYHMWVVNTPTTTGGTSSLRVIDGVGRVVKTYIGNVKVVRSGYRNVLANSATAITCLKNPVEGSKLVALNNEDLTRLKVINASAVLFEEAWGQEADCNIKSCPTGYNEGPNGDCVIKANYTSVPALFKVVEGTSTSNLYGKAGAYLYDINKNELDHSNGSYWQGGSCVGCDRLSKAGIWLDGLAINSWFGVEKCVTIPANGVYYFGYGADDFMRLYIDGVKVDEFQGSRSETFHEVWRVIPYQLTAGKHTIRFDAVNTVEDHAVAVEIYNNDYATLKTGTAGTIDNTIFSSRRDMIDNSSVLVFYTDNSGNITSQNYTCTSGQALNLCDGLVTCGLSRPKGSCPDGYTQSADGQACVPVGNTVSSNTGLNIAHGSVFSGYGDSGVKFYDQNNLEIKHITTNQYYGTPSCEGCGRLSWAGIWLANGYLNQWIGIKACVKVPESKTYYLGYGADNNAKIYIDDVLFKSNTGSEQEAIYTWKVYPKYLTAGQHTITMEVQNTDNEHAVAAEVYGESYETLTTNNYRPSPIFSTETFQLGKTYFTYVKDESGNMVESKFNCGIGQVDVCSEPLTCPTIPNGVVLNPYVNGYLGNWLPYQQKTWLSNRSGQTLVTDATVQPDIRNNGYLPGFRPFWWYDTNWNTSSSENWVTSSTSTLYDRQSQEIESKNALNIYSSARFGFKETMPLAVGGNMRQREMFTDAFEDYGFNAMCVTNAICKPDKFNIYNNYGSGNLDQTVSHTGNYSLRIPSGGINLSSYVFSSEHAPGIYLTTNQYGEYYRQPSPWLGLRGFCPVPGRDYVFSVWVYDGAAPSSTPPLSVKVNGGTYTVTLKKKAAVEGWKLMEGTISKDWVGTTEMGDFSLSITGSGLRIDDIRIFPFDGQMKSYVYSDKTQWLMAELDENNYATFYEYDEEGALIRTKKETERGIMTIKENRSQVRFGNY